VISQTENRCLKYPRWSEVVTCLPRPRPKDAAVQAAGWNAVVSQSAGLDPASMGGGGLVRCERRGSRDNAGLTSVSFQVAPRNRYMAPSTTLRLPSASAPPISNTADRTRARRRAYERDVARRFGSRPLWGDFPDRLQAATGAGVFSIRAAVYAPRRRSRFAASPRLYSVVRLGVLPDCSTPSASPGLLPRPFPWRLDRCDYAGGAGDTVPLPC